MSTALEDRFVDAIGSIDVPGTDLVTAVMTRVVDAPTPQSRRPRLAVAAAVVVLIVVVTLAVEPARTAVADLLGLGATTVEIVPDEELPAGLPANARGTDETDASDTSVPILVDPIPQLGPATEAVDLGAARGRRYSWLAGPDLRALQGTDVGAILSVRLADGPLDRKRIFGDPELEFVTIDVAGEVVPAIWIGAQHELIAAGTDDPVLADTVLIWVVDDIQYRLEADLTLPEMRELAESVEGGTELLRPG